MASVGSIAVNLGMNVGHFERGAKKAEQRLGVMGGKVDGFVSKIPKIAAALGAALSVRALISYAQHVAATIDELGKMADQLDMTTEALGGLNHAAKLQGVEGFDRSLEYMVRRIGEAQQGSGQAVRAFEQLGLTFRDLINLPADQQFALIARRMEGIEKQAQKAATASDIFGRSGGKMLRLFAQGEDGIAAMREEIEKLGYAMGRDQVKAVEDMNDAWTRVKATFAGEFQKILIELAPLVTEFARGLLPIVQALGKIALYGVKAWQALSPLAWVLRSGPGVGRTRPTSEMDRIAETARKRQIADEIAAGHRMVALEQERKRVVEERIKREEHWQKVARGIFEELMTPLQRYNERLDYLNDALKNNAIGMGLFEAATARARQQLAAGVPEFNMFAKRGSNVEIMGRSQQQAVPSPSALVSNRLQHAPGFNVQPLLAAMARSTDKMSESVAVQKNIEGHTADTANALRNLEREPELAL